MKIAFLSFPKMKELLLSELRERFGITQKPAENYGDLIYFENLAVPEMGQKIFPYWARTVMLEPFFITFNTITEVATKLKQIQRNWASYQYTCFRRSQLIQEKLPYINFKDKKFPVTIPQSPIGLYTLTDQHNMIASAKTSSYLPAGTIHFIEDHDNPPSHAYLKIQEALVIANLLNGTEFPHKGQQCFEAGACPGGWTWVLVNLGARVFAVDRSELAPELMRNPLVKFQAHDAFSLKPEDIEKENGKIDWLFSDVICYPERLLQWIQMWLKYNSELNMICTIKMQGDINWQLIRQFEEIDGSKIVHLNYNKHELTWIHTK